MIGLRGENVVSRTISCPRLAPGVYAGNERGVALILALVMLSLLTILGAWALDTSSTDLKIAGNYRGAQYAFYAAEGGVGYTTNPNMLQAVYNFNNAGPGWSSNNISVDLSTKSSFTASVPSLLQGPMPQSGAASTIYDADVGSSGWHGIYTAVTSTGIAVNNSVAIVEACVAQAVPN
jgi:Tfp pilus assembly protein PilX